jgi:hypothetical protein
LALDVAVTVAAAVRATVVPVDTKVVLSSDPSMVIVPVRVAVPTQTTVTLALAEPQSIVVPVELPVTALSVVVATSCPVETRSCAPRVGSGTATLAVLPPCVTVVGMAVEDVPSMATFISATFCLLDRSVHLVSLSAFGV